jgi:hypothetical protein
MILLPPSSKCFNYRCAQPCLTYHFDFSKNLLLEMILYFEIGNQTKMVLGQALDFFLNLCRDRAKCVIPNLEINHQTSPLTLGPSPTFPQLPSAKIHNHL